MFLRKTITRLSPDKLYFYIDLRPKVDFCLKFTSYKLGLQIFRKQGNKWKSEYRDPGIRLLIQAHEGRHGIPVSDFIKQIPEKLRDKVGRFDYLQIKILQICAQSEEGLELFLDLPVLVWLIADYLHKNNLPYDYGKFMVLKKRRDIMRIIFGTAENSDIRILKKIQIQNQLLNKNTISALQVAFENHDIRLFRHYQKIPIQTFLVYYHAPYIKDSGLALTLSKKKYLKHNDLMKEIEQVQRLWEDVSRLGETLEKASLKRLNKCNSMRSLEKLHNKWTDILNRKARSVQDKQIAFLTAPIPINDEIVQIRNMWDLREEGRFMNHCVASYARKILAGTSYIFKVYGPERATLEIQNLDGKIHLGEFKCSFNRKPADETYQYVFKWIGAFLNVKIPNNKSA